MNWNALAGPHNAASLCRSLPSRKAHPLPLLAEKRQHDAKRLPVAASSQANPAAIPCIRLSAIQKTRAPLTDADATLLKST